MAAKLKASVSSHVAAKARKVLKFAEDRATQAADWVELHNALYGLGGKATELFATEAERTAFCKTPEYRRISKLMDTLPAPPVKGFPEPVPTATGAISVRLPRPAHAALLAEAQAEGISLNQLCVSKLVAHLRAVV
jgi:hypothetical protein